MFSLTRRQQVGSRKRVSAVSALVSSGIIALQIAVSAPVQASPLDAKSDGFVRRQVLKSGKSGWTSVIVRFANSTDQSKANEATIRAIDGDIYRHLSIIQSVAVRLPVRNLNRLAALPFVAHISSDVSVQKNDAFTVGSTLANVAAQYGINGTGIGVAVIDSGVHYVNDLQGSNGNSRIVYANSFIPGDASTDDACGHGTHVGGIIAGNGWSSSYNCHQTYIGIASNANIINLRVLDSLGSGTVSTTISAIQWAVNNRYNYNIRVINLSLGHAVGESYKTDPLCQAVESAWKSGIVVVCAAGNGGRVNNDQSACASDNEGFGTTYGSIQSPGNDPYVITVGATKQSDCNRWDDKIATYSSRGPTQGDLVLKPDIVAPGNRIVSTCSYGSTLYNWETSTGNGLPVSAYANTTWCGNSTDYCVLSGTSMAAPVVSGAVAILLQSFPNLSPDAIKARLMTSADRWSLPNGNSDPCTFGAGYLNLVSAYFSPIQSTKTYALSPTVYRSGNSSNVFINGLFYQGTIWGLGNGYGLQNLYGSNAVTSGAKLNPILNPSIVTALGGTQISWGGGGKNGTGTPTVDLSSKALYGEP